MINLFIIIEIHRKNFCIGLQILKKNYKQNWDTFALLILAVSLVHKLRLMSNKKVNMPQVGHFNKNKRRMLQEKKIEMCWSGFSNSWQKKTFYWVSLGELEFYFWFWFKSKHEYLFLKNNWNKSKVKSSQNE